VVCRERKFLSAPNKPIHQCRKSRVLPFLSRKEPPPAKTSVHDAVMSPEVTAGWFSILTFQWVTPLLALGYARPLEAPDLYRLSDDRAASEIGNTILASFERRSLKAAAYNARLISGEVKPGWRVAYWTLRGGREKREKRWREVDGRQRASLIYAMNDSVKWWFWSAGILKVISDTAQVTSPLIVKVSFISLELFLLEVHIDLV